VGRRWETRATIEPNRETWRESPDDAADMGSFQSSSCGYDFVSVCCELDIPDHVLPRDDAVIMEVDASADGSEETALGRCRAAARVVVVVLLDHDAMEALI
jgi:hypothetical protein